jgi:hypothetical protein
MMKKLLALLLLGVTAVAHADDWQTVTQLDGETLRLFNKDVTVGQVLHKQGDTIPMTLRVDRSADDQTLLQAVEIDCKAKTIKAISEAYIYSHGIIVGGMSRNDRSTAVNEHFAQAVINQMCN